MNNSSSSGIGVLGFLGVLFVGLKLSHVINWSWWYVTLPFWGGFALLLTIILVVAIIALVTIVVASIVAKLSK